MVVGAVAHRELIWELVKRDFNSRYKGSMLGIAWSLFNPLVMLVIYTVVFSVAFKARWGSGEESKVAFAIVLFSGMIVHSFFAECINRAPGLITSNANYVKKVVFPLEILSFMAILAGLLNFAIGFGVLLTFCLIAGTPLHFGIALIPVILLPLILLTLGLSWILSSLGVYLRDLAQIASVISTVTLFLAPIFYPSDALPASYQSLLAWNPVTLPVIQLRNLMLWGNPISWAHWAINLAVSGLICQFGYWWFQKTRRGFADVL